MSFSAGSTSSSARATGDIDPPASPGEGGGAQGRLEKPRPHRQTREEALRDHYINISKTAGAVRVMGVLKRSGIPVSSQMIRYTLAGEGLEYAQPYITSILNALVALGQAERAARGLFQLPIALLHIEPDVAEMLVAENAKKIAQAGGSKGVRMRAIALAGGSRLEKIILGMIYERGALMYEEIAAKCVKEGFSPVLVTIQLWALKTRKLIKNPGRGMWTV